MAVISSDCGSHSQCPREAAGTGSPLGTATSRSASCHGRSRGVVDPRRGAKDPSLEGWAKDDHAVPGTHGPLHVLAALGGEDPTPTARVYQSCANVFLLPQSPPAPPLLFQGRCAGDVLLTPNCPSSKTEGLGSQPIPAQLAQHKEPLTPSHHSWQTVPATSR